MQIAKAFIGMAAAGLASAAAADTLAGWPGTPRAIRATTAIEAARALHDPKMTMSPEQLAVHILECMDSSARAMPPETDVRQALRACVTKAKEGH